MGLRSYRICVELHLRFSDLPEILMLRKVSCVFEKYLPLQLVLKGSGNFWDLLDLGSRLCSQLGSKERPDIDSSHCMSDLWNG